ncbi:YciI family protein [Actinophytocola glycyrrhizae]|uniref:YciI family protein n=1 Tax=Actinophytocola glycyrrhizae TaxID=2044873 RepID=A0ABV9SAA3_9PSEU
MRFMLIRKADEESEAGVLPSEELLEAMGRYNEELARAGVLLSGDGLMPSDKGARVHFSGRGKPAVVDGPFAESKELVAGYSVIEVESLAEAVEWVKKWPVEDAHGNAEIEIRQLTEPDDFAAAVTEENRKYTKNISDLIGGK